MDLRNHVIMSHFKSTLCQCSRWVSSKNSPANHQIWLINYICAKDCGVHDDVIKWTQFPRFWPFVRGIYRSPVNSLHKDQWRGALMFSLISDWINSWVNNREARDLRRHRAHYDVTVMFALPCRKKTFQLHPVRSACKSYLLLSHNRPNGTSILFLLHLRDRYLYLDKGDQGLLWLLWSVCSCRPVSDHNQCFGIRHKSLTFALFIYCQKGVKRIVRDKWIWDYDMGHPCRRSNALFWLQHELLGWYKTMFSRTDIIFFI